MMNIYVKVGIAIAIAFSLGSQVMAAEGGNPKKR